MNTQEKITQMFDTISPKYDLTNRILSFGLDKLWRKKMVAQLPKKRGLSLLDVATGTGDVLLEAFYQNKATVGIGIDLSSKMLQLAEEKFRRTPYLSQVNFIQTSALDLPFENETFDAITISYGIRNVQGIEEALKEMKRVLKKGGKLLILEFSLPKNRVIKKAHLTYLRHILPRIGGLISKSADSYQYLNKTIESFPYGEDFISILKKSGFSDATQTPIMGGITTLYGAGV